MDILYQQDGPMLEYNAHDGVINCMGVHNTGSLLALGKDDGTVGLVEVSDGFVHTPNMKAARSFQFYIIECNVLNSGGQGQLGEHV